VRAPERFEKCTLCGSEELDIYKTYVGANEETLRNVVETHKSIKEAIAEIIAWRLQKD